MLVQLINDLQRFQNLQKAKALARFFKTGQGEYGEGDVFWGITVPQQRQVAKKYLNLKLSEVSKLLKSRIHEHRLTALLTLVAKYTRADEKVKKKIFKLYLRNTKFINNWDLVDLSAPNIVGDYLFNNNTTALKKLSKSSNLWERRVAIVATFAFIKKNNFKETLKISELLLHDKEDLIHKAVGWMLREVGKRDEEVEETFLKKYYPQMPRTMLRYAIEKLSERKRRQYLN